MSLSTNSASAAQSHTPQPDTEEILSIAFSRDGNFVASLSQEGMVHIWRAPPSDRPEYYLENGNASHDMNIVEQMPERNIIDSLKLPNTTFTKYITVSNSGDVCAVSFVTIETPFPDFKPFNESILQGHIVAGFNRLKNATRRSSSENDWPQTDPVSLSPIVIQFYRRQDNQASTDPLLEQAEQGRAGSQLGALIQDLKLRSGIVFFGNEPPTDPDMFVCCPPYVLQYRRNVHPPHKFESIRTIYFDMRNIMQNLDPDFNVPFLQSKVNRFALMRQSIPQSNQATYQLRMLMLQNIDAMDIRWRKRFALSSDGSRLAVLSNVDKNVVASQYITIQILFTETGLEIIRWRIKLKPIKVCFHEDKLLIATQKHLHIYDLNTGLGIKKPMELKGNRICLHTQKSYSLQPENAKIRIEPLILEPSMQNPNLELKTMNQQTWEKFQDGKWSLKFEKRAKKKPLEQWICCVKKTEARESESIWPKTFSFQPINTDCITGNENASFKISAFRFSVTKTGAILIVTAITVQLWSLPEGAGLEANYTLRDFWCISRLGELRNKNSNIIESAWTKVETTENMDEVRVFLHVQEDRSKIIKGHHEIVMGGSNEVQKAFNCCYYLMLLSRMISEEQCYWRANLPNLKNVPDLTVEINKILQQYIPTYRFPRIEIGLVDSPILYLFNFPDLDFVFTTYRNYSRCIFSWIYESDAKPDALYSYVSNNILRVKIVRWLIHQTQRGETAYGLLLQKQLPHLIHDYPDLAGEIARGVSFQISVAPFIKTPVFWRLERWPGELENLEVEILTIRKHLDPIIQFTDHVEFPDGLWFVWLAIASRCWRLTTIFFTYLLQFIMKHHPMFSSNLKSATVCVVPLLNLCRYDDSGKSTFTRIAAIATRRNLVEIAEPFLEVIVNHKWRTFARQRFYALSGLYLAYYVFFTIFLENEVSESMPWLSWIVSALAIFFIIMELAKLRHRHGSYFLVFSNYLELCAFILPICCVWIPGWDKTILRPASVLFIWFRILLQLRVIKPFGIFVAVISEIVRSMIPFLVVLVIVYMGFVQAFYEFFKYASPQTGANSIINGFINNVPVNLTMSPFDPSGQNFSQDFLTVMSNVFFFTTQNYGPIALFSSQATLLTILFAIAFTLLLFNVLISLLNNVYTKALESGQRLWLLLMVQIVADIELHPFLFVYSRRHRTDWFPPYIYYIAHDTEIAAYKKMTIRDHPEEYEARQRQMIQWGPDQQFSDLYENIPDVVEVLWDYNLKLDHPHHLQLKRGECIDVVLASPSGWWYGECEDKKGLFPCNFVGPCTIGPTANSLGRTHASGSDTTLAELPDLGVQNDRRRLWYPNEGPLPIPGPYDGEAL